MKLRGIEVQGFKSFADRTKLTFEDGITAIVGPNGSGKSNVSDAVKWVFGEQSVKSLRGAKMEDVIFGGTQNRKPQGFAWVSLTIDNSDRTLDIENDEVILTRKLYRSGESEYKINNSPVRLRDVHELFMDTGLGRDGYSIIEQGKIAEIVSVKSNQRREIFEEAAGISKYRYRKVEAERRLESSEENLIRLRDIMSELEDRVGPLRMQAEKAKQFLVYMQEKKSLEISLWLEKLEKLRIQLKELNDKLLVSRSDRAAAQKQLEDIEHTLEELSRKEQDYIVYIDRKRTEIRQVEETIANSQVVIAVKKNDIEHNLSAIESLNDQIALGTSSAENIDAQILTKQQEYTELQQKLNESISANAQLHKRAEQLRENQLQLDARMNLLGNQKEELRNSIGRAEISRETSQTLIEETLNRLENIRTQSDEKDDAFLKLKKEYRTTKSFTEELTDSIEGLKNSIAGYTVKLQGRQEKQAELQIKINGLEKRIGEKLQRAQLLSDMERNMEGFSGSVKLVMKRVAAGALRGVHGTVSSLIKVDEQYATAIEIALGAAMQNIVVDDESIAKRAISLLKDAGAGRATFLPISTIRPNKINDESLGNNRGYLDVASNLVVAESRFSNIIEWLLGRTIIAEDIDAAIAIGRACGNRYRVVTLDGQVINAGGSLTGGSSGKSGSILSRKNEIESLEREAKQLTAQRKELEEKLALQEQETASIAALLEGVNAEIRTANEDLITANAECKRLSIAIIETEERNKKALEEVDLLKRRLEELRGQGLSSVNLIEKLRTELSDLENELAKAQQDRVKIIGESDECARKQSNLQIETAAMQKDMQVATMELAKLKEQRSGSDTQIQECRDKVEELLMITEMLRHEIEEVECKAAASKELIASAQRDIETKRAEQNALEQRTAQLRKEEKEAVSRKEGVSLELGRLEERHISVAAENDAIISKMWDEYEVTKSEAQELAIKLHDAHAAQKRLSELKNKIKSMGSVNVAAIEEFAEVSERYEFMKAQIGDVEKAKNELIRLITELSAEMSRIFTEKFMAINTNFSQIFTELFGGGKGELILTDPTDPLETGIDIFVQPPGKIIKNLSALSGGEQAFVAICIYFAILKVSPAPFVLIDEIEAALDDVNVTRFAAYLRRMTNRTQFISITHRRGTMEEADVLYGVTMEEEGISKLLRLNVSELEEKLKLKLN